MDTKSEKHHFHCQVCKSIRDKDTEGFAQNSEGRQVQILVLFMETLQTDLQPCVQEKKEMKNM